MNNRTNIVLILKSGGDFKFSDVYLLVTHINKYWQGSNRPSIYCYTDLVTEEKAVVGLTIRPIPNRDWNGWWSKINMFAPSLKELRPFLYLDIDTVVLNSIESFVPPDKAKHKFIALRDFYRPKNLASGFMWIPDTEQMDNLYSEFVANKNTIVRKFKGDQNYIESLVQADLYWQDISKQDWITTFKPNKQWRTEFPENSAIVCFHGQPRIPRAALSVEWVKQYAGYEI